MKNMSNSQSSTAILIGLQGRNSREKHDGEPHCSILEKIPIFLNHQGMGCFVQGKNDWLNLRWHDPSSPFHQWFPLVHHWIFPYALVLVSQNWFFYDIFYTEPNHPTTTRRVLLISTETKWQRKHGKYRIHYGTRSQRKCLITQNPTKRRHNYLLLSCLSSLQDC